MRRRTDFLAENERYVLSIAIWFAHAHTHHWWRFIRCAHRVYPDYCGKSDVRIRKTNPMAINETEEVAVCVYCPHTNAHNCIAEEFRRISRKRHTSFPCWSLRHADYSAALVESPSSRRMVRRPERWAIRIFHSSYRIRSHGPVSV